MTFVKVNPRKRAKRSNSIFDNLFNELMNTSLNELSNNHLVSSRPAVNVIESDVDFQIELSAPGLSKKDFVIDIDDDVLTIEANKELEEKEGVKVVKREFNYNKFKRTFRLPDTIDISNVNATFEAGVLNLTLAKKEEAKKQAPRSVKVK